jgi:hypothetical protein
VKSKAVAALCSAVGRSLFAVMGLGLGADILSSANAMVGGAESRCQYCTG